MTGSGTGSKGVTATSGAARANEQYLQQARPAMDITAFRVFDGVSVFLVRQQ